MNKEKDYRGLGLMVLFWGCVFLVAASFAYRVYGDTQVKDKVPVVVEKPKIPTMLDNLGLTGCDITMGESNHVRPENGSVLATDIHCSEDPFDVFSPTTFPFYVVQFVGNDKRLGQYVIIKHGDTRYVFGHTDTDFLGGERVEGGDKIGRTDLSGITTGMHLHIEKWIGLHNVSLRNNSKNDRSDRLCEQRGWSFCKGENIPLPIRQENKTEKEVKKVVESEHIVQGKCKSNVRIDLVQHAWDISKGDMEFIGTIAFESMFDVGAVGDKGYSYGLCQIHKKYNAWGQNKYRALGTDIEKLEMCFEMYSTWRARGILHKRLYGWLSWEKGLQKLNISCN